MKTHYYKLLTVIFLLVSTSCLKQENGKYIPGVNGPKVNIQNGKIVLSVELENIDLNGGVSLPLPNMRRSSFTISPSFSGNGGFAGTLLKVDFDLKDVESDKFRVVPNETLPDGRDFPFTIDGTLPALAIHVPEFKDSTFYASNKLFGFFLPIDLPEGFKASVHYKIKINGGDYGIVSLIHPDSLGNGAGLIVLLTLEQVRSNPGFQKILKLSKKNRNRLY